MRAIIGILIALVCLALAGLPIPFPGDDGAYNTLSGMYWCANLRACVHERGHKLDQEREWPSQAPEFAEAVQIFMVAEIRSEKPSETALLILRDWSSNYRFGVDPKAELYADIYELADGDVWRIPQGLREFFGDVK